MKLCTERAAVEGRSPLCMLTAGALFPVGLFVLFLQTCEVGLCCECFISSRFDFGLNLLIIFRWLLGKAGMSRCPSKLTLGRLRGRRLRGELSPQRSPGAMRPVPAWPGVQGACCVPPLRCWPGFPMASLRGSQTPLSLTPVTGSGCLPVAVSSGLSD